MTFTFAIVSNCSPLCNQMLFFFTAPNKIRTWFYKNDLLPCTSFSWSSVFHIHSIEIHSEFQFAFFESPVQPATLFWFLSTLTSLWTLPVHVASPTDLNLCIPSNTLMDILNKEHDVSSETALEQVLLDSPPPSPTFQFSIGNVFTIFSQHVFNSYLKS